MSQTLNHASRPPTAREVALAVHEHDMRLHVIRLAAVFIDECAGDGGGAEALLQPIQEQLHHVPRAHVAK